MPSCHVSPEAFKDAAFRHDLVSVDGVYFVTLLRNLVTSIYLSGYNRVGEGISEYLFGYNPSTHTLTRHPWHEVCNKFSMLEKLKDIKSCPECECKQISEERKYSQHTNGHWNETVKFACGYTVTFSPNYMKVMPESKSCDRSKEYKDMMDKRKIFKEKLGQFIDGGKIDDEYRNQLKRTFNLY